MCMLMCMCMLDRRVQILFDKDSWNKLVKHAKAQNISAGEYIRTAVRDYVDKQKELLSKEQKTPFNRLFKRQVKQQ